MQFLGRTVFIYSLGELYLGLNSLFASTLNFLSLAELGIGSAMVFSMYKPLAEKDNVTICALLNLYRRVYRIIGIIMLLIGFILLFFLPYLIRGQVPEGVNIKLLYVIYLSNTVLSYFLYAYKGSVLIADQRSDIKSNVSSVLVILTNLFQVVTLVLFKNYYVYCSVFVAFTIINNLIVNHIVNKRYPEFKCTGKLDKGILNDIKKRVAGLFVYKICYVFRDALDAIFISAYIGLSILGKYNNYMFILNTITGLLLLIRTSITASIGNSLAVESEQKNYSDFNKCQMLYMWVSIWCTICLFCLLHPFIKLWIGENYILGDIELFLFSIYFFCYKLGDICSTYRQAAGLWWQDKYRPIVEAVVKTILNLIIIRWIGVSGALGGSIFCLLFINSIWASWVLYKYCFRSYRQKEYILRNIFYLFVTILLCIIVGYICNLLPETGIQYFIYRVIICLIVPNLCLWIIFRLLPEFKDGVIMAKRVIKA